MTQDLDKSTRLLLDANILYSRRLFQFLEALEEELQLCQIFYALHSVNECIHSKKLSQNFKEADIEYYSTYIENLNRLITHTNSDFKGVMYDESDRYLVNAAIEASCHLIISYDTKAFNKKALRSYNLAVCTPDLYLQQNIIQGKLSTSWLNNNLSKEICHSLQLTKTAKFLT